HQGGQDREGEGREALRSWHRIRAGMIFQQILNEESGCLSYLIGCGQAGQAVIVDPGRDRVHEYLRLARRKGLQITHVVETHTHADHISGNRDLAAATNAAIFAHRAAGLAFDHERLSDGDELRVGNIRLKVAHTPGHTPDSVCLLVTDLDRGPEPWFVLTGDTLFVGSVGRPDLGGTRAAEEAYESLTRVLLPLDDSLEIYPAHGAGPASGRAQRLDRQPAVRRARRVGGSGRRAAAAPGAGAVGPRARGAGALARRCGRGRWVFALGNDRVEERGISRGVRPADHRARPRGV